MFSLKPGLHRLGEAVVGVAAVASSAVFVRPCHQQAESCINHSHTQQPDNVTSSSLSSRASSRSASSQEKEQRKSRSGSPDSEGRRYCIGEDDGAASLYRPPQLDDWEKSDNWEVVKYDTPPYYATIGNALDGETVWKYLSERMFPGGNQVTGEMATMYKERFLFIISQLQAAPRGAGHPCRVWNYEKKFVGETGEPESSIHCYGELAHRALSITDVATLLQDKRWSLASRDLGTLLFEAAKRCCLRWRGELGKMFCSSAPDQKTVDGVRKRLDSQLKRVYGPWIVVAWNGGPWNVGRSLRGALDRLDQLDKDIRSDKKVSFAASNGRETTPVTHQK